jgi:hypothetical protein
VARSSGVVVATILCVGREADALTEENHLSQDLTDANCFLANSPASKYTNQNVSPYLLQSLFHEHNLDEQRTAFYLCSAGESRISFTILSLFVD